jgi:hypothetical protein
MAEERPADGKLQEENSIPGLFTVNHRVSV